MKMYRFLAKQHVSGVQSIRRR